MSKVWMITGAGRGLGRAFTEEAVRNGDQVIATVRKINPSDGLLTNENVFIGKKCCEAVRDYLKDRIAEIASYIEASSQTDFE